MQFSTICGALAAATLTFATAARAEAPLATEVYGATMERGITEFEARYGRLAGGDDGGTELTKLEVAHAFSDRLWGGLVAKIGREPGDRRRFEGFEIEGRAALGRVGGFNLAAMVELEANRGDSDVLGGKFIVERRAGPFDARVNFIGERALAHGAPVVLGYAAEATSEVAEHVSLGAQAVGGLGAARHISLRDDHFAGPIARLEFEGDEKNHEATGGFEFEAGYLFAIGRARAGSRGQIKLGIDYERRF